MPALLEIERQNKIRTGELLKARPIYLQALADYNKSHGKFVYQTPTHHYVLPSAT